MNVVEFNPNDNPLAFCFIDNTHQYASAWTTELVKNLADHTISNLTGKNYPIYQSQNEEHVLAHAIQQGHKYALVFSTGTEFINGRSFFIEIEKLIQTDFYVYGHILDRGDAYYELHNQCYLLNLDRYQELGHPEIGQYELGATHSQITPDRSTENFHDNYTPLWIKPGNSIKTYNHKLHGWNLISAIMSAGGAISAFNNNIRNNKKHYYPENQKEFLKHVSWSYSRKDYCANEFVHYQNTENLLLDDHDYEKIITPASGTWFVNFIHKERPVTVLFYDYNQKALDYWREHAPKIDNVTYQYLKIDLLGQYSIGDLIQPTDQKTLINLSNIFCYEGTAMFSSLEYRLHKENELLIHIPKTWKVLFSERSIQGFTKQQNNVKIVELVKPTWHFGGDWIE
jgi:hypothetical protein